MNNDHNNNYYYNYYRDYINYLYSTNSIIQQNINLLQNNCYNLYYLNRHFINNYYLQNNNHNINEQTNDQIIYNRYNNTSIPNYNINPNSINAPNTNINEVSNNNLQNIFYEVFNEIRLIENENIYNFILNNCISYNKFYEIENPINEECPINQTEFYEYDDVIIINSCNHIFNPNAIKHWFKNNHTCPLCRNNLLENTNYEPQNSYLFRF